MKAMMIWIKKFFSKKEVTKTYPLLLPAIEFQAVGRRVKVRFQVTYERKFVLDWIEFLLIDWVLPSENKMIDAAIDVAAQKTLMLAVLTNQIKKAHLESKNLEYVLPTILGHLSRTFKHEGVTITVIHQHWIEVV